MTRKILFALATSAAVLLALPASPLAQSHRARAAAKGGSPDSAGGTSGQSRGSSEGNSGRHTASAPPSGGDSNRAGRAAARRGDGSENSGRPASGARTRGSSGDDSDRGSSTAAAGRQRDGRNVRGRAVERSPDPTSGGGGTTIVVTDRGYYGGGFYPWGYGGLGLGGYSGGLYDPWWYGDAPYSGSGDGYAYEGSLKLKVTPRDASVYVDGYFAGRVDDFDGLFQSLRIESGPHRVEVREDGFEPLTFEVRIQPDRTVTYTGELRPLP